MYFMPAFFARFAHSRAASFRGLNSRANFSHSLTEILAQYMSSAPRNRGWE